MFVSEPLMEKVNTNKYLDPVAWLAWVISPVDDVASDTAFPLDMFHLNRMCSK